MCSFISQLTANFLSPTWCPYSPHILIDSRSKARELRYCTQHALRFSGPRLVFFFSLFPTHPFSLSLPLRPFLFVVRAKICDASLPPRVTRLPPYFLGQLGYSMDWRYLGLSSVDAQDIGSQKIVLQLRLPD